MVTFNKIDPNLRVPLVTVEFDSSNAQSGSAGQSYRVLMIAQRTSAGTLLELVPQRVTSAADVSVLAGPGSMAHAMAVAYFASNRFTETWLVLQDDDGAAADATATLTVTGAPTAAGTVYLYVNFIRLQVGVTTSSTPTAIAAAIVAAVNARTDLQCTAANVAGVVTLTAKNGGAAGNDQNVRLNYYDGEALPAGIGIAIVDFAGGTGDPDVSDVWPVLGEVQYHVMIMGCNGSATRASVHTELQSRWDPPRENEGLAIFGMRETLSALLALGSTLNSQFYGILGADDAPNTPWEWAAAAGAHIAREGATDPARPFTALELIGLGAPKADKRFDVTEQNQLLFDGISTYDVGPGGEVRINALITTYQKNPLGADDTAYLFIMAPLTLSRLRYEWKQRIALKYPRHKLANDGTRFAAGQPIMTPSIGRAEALAWFRDMEELGLVEDFEQFKADLVVERDATNPNRMNWLLPANLINALLVRAASIQFRS